MTKLPSINDRGRLRRGLIGLLVIGWLSGSVANCDDATVTQTDQFVSNTRQLTFDGLRSGEGYFDDSGNRMVFQSERDPSNPFYQIYVSDLETGDIRRVSPGTGKTTCAWIHPDGDRILFASTHEDPDAESKQIAKLEQRAQGRESRYSWDYDPNYELYEQNTTTGTYTRLTDARGYDAEGSYSPDGTHIVFASNRAAYETKLEGRDAEMFELDPAYMMDLYIMKADGSDVRRLTDERGYDGGPFFSSNGAQICWRRFSPDGATAEIFVMDRDGSNVRRLTNLQKMSWAPFFHPSGEYLIFTTNQLGFANFELFIVRSDGRGEPVRVTHTDGFDGLPVFLADGTRLSWTSNRGPKKRSQIYLADWDHEAARQALSLDGRDDVDASKAIAQTSADYRQSDLIRHVDYLTRKELGGRLTGTDGEKKATAYVASVLDGLGYVPAGDRRTDGSRSFFHEFDFPEGSRVAEASLSIDGEALVTDRDFRPMAFTGDGEFDSDEVVFAGYGLQIPADPNAEGNADGSEAAEYDSYVHLNVADRIVMVLRDLPQDITPEMRQRMARYGAPRRKASVARDLGAKGIIFVAGPTSQVKNELIRFDTSAAAGVSMMAASVTNAIAQRMLAASGESLEELQKSLDDGSMRMGFLVENVKLSGRFEIERRRGTGRSVIARLPADRSKTTPTYPVAMIGAHIDHLGRGAGGGSLAKEDQVDQIHFGADDNASGVAAMLEIAQYIADRVRTAQMSLKRDLVVAAWSGEELGLYGSKAFVEGLPKWYDDVPIASVDPEQARVAAAHGMSPQAAPLNTAIGAYLNLDMVGRFNEKLVVQGLGSSPGLDAMVKRRNIPVRLPLTLDPTATRLPTDAAAFVARDVPIVSFFTGAHEDYHTPGDTADKLNYDAMVPIAKLGGLILRGWLIDEQLPRFELDEQSAGDGDAPRARLTAYLGTIPDYVAGDIKGLKLSGVAQGGPADKAGVRGGDIIVGLAGKKIENIYDYTYAIEAVKIGQEVEIIVRRGDKTVPLRITPGSRE